MKKTRRPIQKTLDTLAPAVAPVKRERNKSERTSVSLVGEPFISPVAQIPTNRSLLLPTAKPR